MVYYLVCSLKTKLRSIKQKAEFIIIEQSVPRCTRAGIDLVLRFHHDPLAPSHTHSALISLPHLSPSSRSGLYLSSPNSKRLVKALHFYLLCSKQSHMKMSLTDQFQILLEESDYISCRQMFIPEPINHIHGNNVICYKESHKEFFFCNYVD